MAHLVSPSLLAADFGNLQKDIEMVNHSMADWFHLDIMDGVFVPNISFGFPVISFINKYASKPLDVHLMISNPESYLSRFRDAGADILTIHYESTVHLHRNVTEIRRLGMKAGVAINPHTPVDSLKDILPWVDMILIMTVNPGYGGQKFIQTSYRRIAELRKMIDENNYKVYIQVDGGVDIANTPDLLAAGVDVLVAGTTVFGSDDPAGAIEKLKSAKPS
ncbi:MAG: ribulose-phosphate 3-epimerase [Bacteroidales bacterium]|nr:ribulose-phosphate 3-epimerase [Bacteroidales bacterium]